jgi:hypothetical protein
MTDRKTILKWKGIVLGLTLLLVAALLWTIRHYFYILDAYYYTAEFHVLFMVNNLNNANLRVFVEYFSSIGSPFAAVPWLSLAHLMQNVWALFTKPILPTVAILSLGGLPGAAITFAVLFLIGMLFYGLGIFFFGDILFFVKKNRNSGEASRAKSVEAIPFLALAVPYLPLFIGIGPAAILRVPLKRMMVVLVCGLAIRTVLSVWVSGL